MELNLLQSIFAKCDLFEISYGRSYLTRRIRLRQYRSSKVFNRTNFILSSSTPN